MWTLVLISLMANTHNSDLEPVIEGWYKFNTIEECFISREKIIYDLGSRNGFPPINKQMVCIRSDEKPQ